MYIIITFHISSKILFPSVVILLHRSNGCIIQLWQAKLPPYPLPIIWHKLRTPSFSQTAEQSKQKVKNMQNEGFFTLSLPDDWDRDGITGWVKKELTSVKYDCLQDCRAFVSVWEESTSVGHVFSTFSLENLMLHICRLALMPHDLLWDTVHSPVNLALKHDGPWWTHREEEWINECINDWASDWVKKLLSW